MHSASKNERDGNVGRVVLHKNGSSCLDRNVRSRADRYADRRRRKRWRIIDAVPHHGDPTAPLLEAPDLCSLVTWQHLGPHIIDGERAGHCLGGGPAVTREERSGEHTAELQSPWNLVSPLLLEKKKSPTRRTCAS